MKHASFSGRGVRLQRMLRPLTACLFYLLFAAPAWAQPEVDALRVYLGTSGSTCTLHSGSGAPSGSLGSVCDVYVRADSPYTVYAKTGASAWSVVQAQEGVAAGQVLVSAGTGTAAAYSATPSVTSVTATDTATAVLAQSTFPALHLWDTNSSADEKRWALIANGDSFWLRALDDAWTASVSNPLEIQRTGITIDRINLSATVTGSSDYVSQTTGWGITDAGGGDFRFLFADEMHVRTFITDLEQALAGLQIITKSVAVLSDDFTCPAASGTATLSVEDLPGAADMQVFDASDWVSVRSFARASQTLTIGDCVGQVSAPNTTPSGYQEWTFTRGAGGSAGSMTASTVVARGTVVLDYGVSGAGYYEVNAVDGIDAVNSPYAQVVTWATAPVAANRTVRSRFGNLLGITGVSGEYGMLAGTYDTDSDAQYFRASNQAVQLVGVDLLMYDGATNVFRIDRGGGTAPYLSLGSPAPTTYGSGTGIWMGDDSGTYKFRVGNPSANQIRWDGTNLTIGQGTVTVDSTGIVVTPHSAATFNGPNAYRWSVASGTLGATGYDFDSAGTRNMGVILAAEYGLNANNSIQAQLSARSGYNANTAQVSAVATQNSAKLILTTTQNATVNGGTIEIGGYQDFKPDGTTAAGTLCGYLIAAYQGDTTNTIRIPFYAASGGSCPTVP